MRFNPPAAAHPFFWAGYLLVDTGTSPQPDEPPAEQDDPDQAAAR